MPLCLFDIGSTLSAFSVKAPAPETRVYISSFLTVARWRNWADLAEKKWYVVFIIIGDY